MDVLTKQVLIKSEHYSKYVTIELYNYLFKEESLQMVLNKPFGSNWPVVYIIKGGNTVYIGETADISIRMKQHLLNDERKKLKVIYIIFDNEANKSSILDIEQNLIRLYSSESGINIQNKNFGQSPSHNYYHRPEYLSRIQTIWDMLIEANAAKSKYNTLINTQLFKYSPYTSLTESQKDVIQQTLKSICKALVQDEQIIVIIDGGAGTGKTLIATELMLFLSQLNGSSSVSLKSDEGEISIEDLDIIEYADDFIESDKSNINFGLVMPTVSTRLTIGQVFKSISGLSKKMILSPYDVVSNSVEDKKSKTIQRIVKPYDILVVDESHRLCYDKNIQNHNHYRIRQKQLGLNSQSSQLDWILKCSKCTVLLYDKNQSVKSSDISIEQFDNSIKQYGKTIIHLTLSDQLRCRGGNKFINYIDSIFNSNVVKKEVFSNTFEFKLYSNVDQMYDDIKQKDKSWGLSRVVAGYSWTWKTKTIKEMKNKSFPVNSIAPDDRDIDLGRHYVWNKPDLEYVIRENSIDEIGSIHTVQGYDLNYVGVIIGPEVDYDYDRKMITIDPSKSCDPGVTRMTSATDQIRYIKNAYKVLLTRGIRGCYIYVCNNNLHRYLNQYIPPNN